MASKVYARVPSDEVEDLLRELKDGDATRITKARNVDGTFRITAITGTTPEHDLFISYTTEDSISASLIL